MSDVLDCPMDPSTNDAGASTVREYLAKLLEALWKEEDSFSGKRPFGNSGWPYEVYGALVRGGFISGSFDADGYLDEVDSRTGEKTVLAAIQSLR